MITDPESIRTVESARAGDRGAFDEIVRSYAGFVHSIAMRTVFDPEDACDIVQEVFVKAWLNIGLLRDCASFPAWLASIGRRASVDHLRRKSPAASPDGEHIEEYPSPEAPAPVRGDILERAMALLPERDRALLTMVYFGDLTHGEAGEVLGLPGRSVRVYLLRARRRLRALLEGREDELLQQIG